MSSSAERLLLAACALALAAPAPAQAAGELFTVAGTGRPGALGDGGPATAAAIGPSTTVAALPGGGFVIGERGRVRIVDPAGRIRTLAANVDPIDVAVAADGSVLLAECLDDPKDVFATIGQVRRIAPDGTITTVASGVGCPTGVAALPDGAFLIAGDEQVRRVDAGGTITTVAGTGELPESRLSGSRPARQVAMRPRELAVTADGRILIADDWTCTVLEVRPDGLASVVAGTGFHGRRPDEGLPAVSASVCPVALAALPDGGFLVADQGESSLVGEQPRVRRVGPDGRIATVAGSGRFVPNPPRLLERRGDGGPATRADLRPITDIAATPDGGVLIAEGVDYDDVGVEGLIRYLAPATPGLLAAALARDSDRFFTPGGAAAVTLVTTAPAAVTLSAAGRDQTVTVPAGRTRMALPALPRRAPYTVTLSATDAAGRVAVDRLQLIPRGWLSDEVVRYAARGLMFAATGWSQVSGDALFGCRRFGPRRVDCGLDDNNGRRCEIAVTIRLGADRRLRWGAYGCPYRTRPHLQRRLRPFAARDTSCEASDTSCVRFTGVLADRRLLPWG